MLQLSRAWPIFTVNMCPHQGYLCPATGNAWCIVVAFGVSVLAQQVEGHRAIQTTNPVHHRGPTCNSWENSRPLAWREGGGGLRLSRCLLLCRRRLKKGIRLSCVCSICHVSSRNGRSGLTSIGSCQDHYYTLHDHRR